MQRYKKTSFRDLIVINNSENEAGDVLAKESQALCAQGKGKGMAEHDVVVLQLQEKRTCGKVSGAFKIEGKAMPHLLWIRAIVGKVLNGGRSVKQQKAGKVTAHVDHKLEIGKIKLYLFGITARLPEQTDRYATTGIGHCCREKRIFSRMRMTYGTLGKSGEVEGGEGCALSGDDGRSRDTGIAGRCLIAFPYGRVKLRVLIKQKHPLTTSFLRELRPEIIGLGQSAVRDVADVCDAVRKGRLLLVIVGRRVVIDEKLLNMIGSDEGAVTRRIAQRSLVDDNDRIYRLHNSYLPMRNFSPGFQTGLMWQMKMKTTICSTFCPLTKNSSS